LILEHFFISVVLVGAGVHHSCGKSRYSLINPIAQPAVHKAAMAKQTVTPANSFSYSAI